MTKKDKIYIDIMNKMFDIAGHDMDYDRACNVIEYYTKYTMTNDQHDKWMKYGIALIQRKTGYTTHYCNELMAMINLNNGLKVLN